MIMQIVKKSVSVTINSKAYIRSPGDTQTFKATSKPHPNFSNNIITRMINKVKETYQMKVVHNLTKELS